MHVAAQYLAAAGISFLDKKNDDSHTNLGWDGINYRLTTHAFDKSSFRVGLNIKTGHLEWFKEGVIVSTIDLQKSIHSEVLAWFDDLVEKQAVGRKYCYEFHYELPYAKVSFDDSFSFDKADSQVFGNLLTIAQNAFEGFLSENGLESPIRVWPHHFDIGIYTKLSEELFMGAGLAIPDALVDDHYYYATGWKSGSAVSTDTFTGLDRGEWRKDWAGATLPSKGITVEGATRFLNQAREVFDK